MGFWDTREHSGQATSQRHLGDPPLPLLLGFPSSWEGVSGFCASRALGENLGWTLMAQRAWPGPGCPSQETTPSLATVSIQERRLHLRDLSTEASCDQLWIHFSGPSQPCQVCHPPAPCLQWVPHPKEAERARLRGRRNTAPLYRPHPRSLAFRSLQEL